MIRTLITTVALTGLSLGSAWACGGHKEVTAEADAVQDVQVEQLASWVKTSEARVYDANGRATFEAGHIPGAVHVDYAAIDVSQLPTEADAKMVFYCKNEMCGASKKAAKQVASMGFKNVFVFKAGIDGWAKAGHTVAKVEPTKAAAPAKAEG